MAILIHDYYELEERAGKHLRAWKAWHIIIYALAAVFGILNYVFLHKTMSVVDDHCVLRAPQVVLTPVLVYHPRPEAAAGNDTEVTRPTTVPVTTDTSRSNGRTEIEEAIAKNASLEERLALDLMKTFFGSRSDCEFPEYMPIVSTVFALVWTTLFVMCPGGGHARFGLTQPWRILAPALVFTLVLVGLTASSFTHTNRGLREFCSAFYNYTNATTCSSVNVYMERSWNASWQFGARAEATRAASAGVWVSWACAATLLVVRCLTAPDFQLKKTGVYLTKDPEQKITPHLLKSRRRGGKSPSPSKSVRSEPTATTELVTNLEPDSAPTSRLGTPLPPGEKDSSV
ncbi:uncharacterized protein LOC125232818 [Leguminivora glycinivorella]|uniref:uncharacterized protein LOC125232818 n=1 Tax=Leguminivora glycinivorella TaxID=1035111 RepID=UPI00200D4F30|nr:uncharacterized protein LOC125232818 [Leguminivora glycinivorella]